MPNIRLILAYKSMPGAVSHIGLGVAALNTCKVLQSKAGIRVEVWPTQSAAWLETKLTQAQKEDVPVTHLVMSAPWIQTTDWSRLCSNFHRVQFACTSHSNVGFLQADPFAADFMSRDGIGLEAGFPNFSLAANSQTLCSFIQAGYTSPCQYLPNLYFLNGATPAIRPQWVSGTLRIGCFGAGRVQKNIVTAAAAAIQVASTLRATLQFWVSGGRTDGMGGSSGMVAQKLVESCKFASYHPVAWEPWPQFRKTVANMHLMMQPSTTETFNIVSADGVAEGVPSVVSSAIDWLPDHWMADADDAGDVAKVGINLLRDHNAPADGMKALVAHVTTGIAEWKSWIAATTQPTGKD